MGSHKLLKEFLVTVTVSSDLFDPCSILDLEHQRSTRRYVLPFANHSLKGHSLEASLFYFSYEQRVGVPLVEKRCGLNFVKSAEESPRFEESFLVSCNVKKRDGFLVFWVMLSDERTRSVEFEESDGFLPTLVSEDSRKILLILVEYELLSFPNEFITLVK